MGWPGCKTIGLTVLKVNWRSRHLNLFHATHFKEWLDLTTIYFCSISAAPQVEIKGSPEIYVNSGSHQVELQCLLTDVLEEPPFIFWYATFVFSSNANRHAITVATEWWRTLRYYDDRRLLIDSAGDVQQDRPAAEAQAWAFDDDSSITAHRSDDAADDTAPAGSYDEDQLDYGLNQDNNHNSDDVDNGGDKQDENSATIRKSKPERPHGRRRYKEPSIKCNLTRQQQLPCCFHYISLLTSKCAPSVFFFFQVLFKVMPCCWQIFFSLTRKAMQLWKLKSKKFSNQVK